MKRRDFIKSGAVLVGTAATIPTAAKLYGAPASVQPREIADLDKFKLPLSRAAVPPELWEGLARISRLWENVLTDNTEGAAFYSNPTAYFASLGLDASDRTLVNESVLMLKAMTDPIVKGALAVADYASVYARLMQIGVFDASQPSLMQENIERLFEANIEELRSSLASSQPLVSRLEMDTLLSSMDESGLKLTEDDLVALSKTLSLQVGTERMQPSCTALALCVAAVGILATVIAYVSVVVAATVGILAAVFVSAAVKTAVTVGGGGRADGGAAPDLVMVTVVGTENSTLSLQAIHSPLASAPFKGTYAKLDPTLLKNADRVIRLAAMTGHDGLQVHVARIVIHNEIKAVFSAMRTVNLLKLPEESLSKVVEVVTLYSWKMLGINAQVQTGAHQ